MKILDYDCYHHQNMGANEHDTSFDKWFKNYKQMYGKDAIYDFKQSQSDRFILKSKNKGDDLVVVSYSDKSRSVANRMINISKFKITSIKRSVSNKGGVVFGKQTGETRVFSHIQFAKSYGFMLNKNYNFKRRAFHQP